MQTLPKLTDSQAALVTKILQKKGEFTRLVYERPLKFRAAFKDFDGVKHTEMTVRIGISYEELKSVKEKRESGELPMESTGLKGVEFIVFPTLLKNAQNELLLRVYFHKNYHKKTAYYLNGVEVSKDDLREYCLASEFAEKEDGCLNIKISKIIEMS